MAKVLIGNIKGPKGEPGKNAYEYALDGGFGGTEDEFSTELAKTSPIDSDGTVEKDINMNSHKLTGLSSPTENSEASPKSYVDNAKTEAVDYARKVGASRNLLDNSDFGNPVNQRWSSSYTVSGYTIDRWRTWADGAVNIVDGGITNTVNLYQYLEPGTIDGSKIYTFAVGYADGSITMVSGKFADGPGNDLIGLITDPDNGLDRVAINSSDKTAQWAALYEGEYTADNLPKYQPKGYAVELAECRRYYQMVGQLISTGAAAVGYCYSATSVRFVTSISPMRQENPTVTLVSTDSVPMVICNGSVIARGALTFMAYTYINGQHLAINVTVEGGTQFATAFLVTNNASYFELSADL